jgi:6,7-dimethyl-8-ribityllumazine synthase
MRILEGEFNAAGTRIAIVASRFKRFHNRKNHRRSGFDCIRRNGGSENDVTLIRVPGAFEIAPAARTAARSGSFDAVICLGAVIRGSTPHFDYVAAEAAKGIAHVSFETNIPVIFGVLTTDNIEQAVERAGTKSGNKDLTPP